MTLRRALLALIAAAMLSTLPGIALGHVSLVSSTPAAGENLDAPPDEVLITFDDEIDPDGSTFTVLDHHGEEVGTGSLDLDVAERNVLRGDVSITETGVYTVQYEVIGLDGHEITGEFSFGYRADEEIPDAEGSHHDDDSPDTAMRGTGVSLATVAGVLLVVGAGALAVRRRQLG